MLKLRDVLAELADSPQKLESTLTVLDDWATSFREGRARKPSPG